MDNKLVLILCSGVVLLFIFSAGFLAGDTVKEAMDTTSTSSTVGTTSTTSSTTTNLGTTLTTTTELGTTTTTTTTTSTSTTSTTKLVAISSRLIVTTTTTTVSSNCRGFISGGSWNRTKMMMCRLGYKKIESNKNTTNSTIRW